MEPASIASIAGNVLTVGGKIYTLVGKYNDAPEFLRHLSGDCHLLGGLATRLQQFAMREGTSTDMTILKGLAAELLRDLKNVERILPTGSPESFRSRASMLYHNNEFHASLGRIRNARENIALLLHISQVNAMTGSSANPATGLPEPSQLHNDLYRGGKEPTEITRQSLRRITDEPEFRGLKNAASGILSRLSRLAKRKHNTKTNELHDAIEHSRHEAVRKILASGQDPNASCRGRVSPLHRAVAIGSHDRAYTVACTLVCFGANLTKQDKKGNTPLALALKYQRPLKWIMMLCEMDDDKKSHHAPRATTFRDDQGDTVLHTAINIKLPVEYVTVLLAYWAPVDERTRGSLPYSPVSLAVKQGQAEYVAILLEFHAQNCVENGLSSMQRACHDGHEQVVKVLLENIGYPDDVPSPLTLAAAEGHLGVVQELLRYGIDPNKGREDDHHPSALEEAVRNGKVDVVRTLLDEGADPNPNRRQAPLSAAVRHRDAQMVNILVRGGANVNLGTPLYEAVDVGSYSTTSTLLQHKADIYVEPSPFECAARRDRVDIIELFLRYGAQPSDFPLALFEAANANSLEALEKLLELGMEIDRHFIDEGRTELGTAVLAGHLKAAEVLIDHGASVNHIDENDCDVLGYAIAGDMDTTTRTEMIRLLLDNGALCRPSPDSNGRCAPALIRAAGCGRNEVVRILAHEDFSITDSWSPNLRGRWTPLTMAISAGQVSTAKLLCSLGCELVADSPGQPSLLCLAARHPGMIEFEGI